MEISSKRLGCALVITEHDCIGIVTDGDIRRHLGPSLFSKNAQQIMTRNPVMIAPNELASKALAMMQQRSITSIVVSDKQKTIGLLHIHDCLRAGLS